MGTARIEPPPCRKLPGGCGGAAARKAAQRQEPTGNSSWRNWLFGSSWLDTKAAPLVGTASNVGGAVNGRGVAPKLAPTRIDFPGGLPTPTFRGPCKGSERSAGRAACAQCVQHTRPLVAAACLLRQRLAVDAQALATRCAIVLGLSCLGSDRSLGFAVISAASPACGTDHSFEFVATASGPQQYQYKMQLTALDAVGTLPEAGGGSYRVYWANASDLPLLRSDSLEASVTLLSASRSQLHHGVPDFRGYGAFDTCVGCALATAAVAVDTPANHAAATLPRCRGANPGVFAAVSSCKDLVDGRAACTGDVRQLNFDDSFKHVITPPACRYHVYSASDFASCRRGRSVLFVGDSIMHGFYQDFGQMFGAFAPSRCRATDVRGGRDHSWLHYEDIRMPFGKGLLNLFRKDFWKKVDPIARFDVVVLGSVMHDLALKTPFETYAANLRRVVAWIRQVRRKRASVRFIWLGGTKSALEPNCLFLAWDNQLPSLVKFANRIAEQIMRQAGIETFDIYSLMSSSEPSWYYGYGAGRQVGHLAQCYGKPAINASARAVPFGGGLSKMLSQALASQVCGLGKE